MTESSIEIELIDDPVEVARCKEQAERARRNRKWLEAHWADVLPAARGRFLAVAGQRAFLADTSERVWELAESTFPEDNGAFVQYVPKEMGPRIYANQR